MPSCVNSSSGAKQGVQYTRKVDRPADEKEGEQVLSTAWKPRPAWRREPGSCWFSPGGGTVGLLLPGGFDGRRQEP